jgi:hypothetical protein
MRTLAQDFDQIDLDLRGLVIWGLITFWMFVIMACVMFRYGP